MSIKHHTAGGAPIEPGTPTQIAHPWRAVLRTIVAAGVGVALAWAVRVVGIDLTGLSEPIVDSLTTGTALVLTAVFQYLLTRPALQGFWRAVGLGTGVHTEREVDDGPKHRAT